MTWCARLVSRFGALPTQPTGSPLRRSGTSFTGVRDAINGSRATASNLSGAPQTSPSFKGPISNAMRTPSLLVSSAHPVELATAVASPADEEFPSQSLSDELVPMRPCGSPTVSGPIKVWFSRWLASLYPTFERIRFRGLCRVSQTPNCNIFTCTRTHRPTAGQFAERPGVSHFRTAPPFSAWKMGKGPFRLDR